MVRSGPSDRHLLDRPIQTRTFNRRLERFSTSSNRTRRSHARFIFEAAMGQVGVIPALRLHACVLDPMGCSFTERSLCLIPRVCPFGAPLVEFSPDTDHGYDEW